MIFQNVKATILKYGMLSLNDKIVVALSGGPDSVALLHILHSLSTDYSLTLYAAHLNHLLRGREAEEDAYFVRELAKKLKVEIRTEEADVKREAKEKGLSLQEAARRVRYDFLKRMAREVGASKVALGHQLDDQVETIFLRLIRGTGAEGFRGIPPKRELDDKITIIRPLIDISCQQIREYLKEKAVSFRTDSSNLCEDYLRNKVRLALLPLLCQLNPGFRERLIRTAKLWQADDEYLCAITEEKFCQAILKDEERIVLDLKGLKGLRTPILSRILREAVKKARGDLRGITFPHIQAILRLIREGPSQGKVDLPEGLVVEREYERLRIGIRNQESGIRFKYKIEVPETVEIREAGVKIQAKMAAGGEVEFASNIAYFDLDKIKPPLIIRSRKEGDKFCPFGFAGTKKIKDLFIDLKIPARQRDRIPLLVDREGILWVVGYRRSNRAKVDSQIKRILEVKIKKINTEQH